MDRACFVREFGGMYEHSPWVAEAVVGRRPFSNRRALAAAMGEVVEQAPPEKKLELIQAHPDLGGKLGRQRELSEHSAREQSRLGLDRLEDSEFQEFTRLNQGYRERFGFPFILCVALVEKAGILDAFRRRLENSREAEVEEALRQIHLIAKLRLEQAIEPAA
ncbi:MAG: 2-oxo-4-hydroxy-4-carboxy-5-ureidoimidazoline decarboxylase [Verrucomicrobiota bacterium]